MAGAPDDYDPLLELVGNARRIDCCWHWTFFLLEPLGLPELRRAASRLPLSGGRKKGADLLVRGLRKVLVPQTNGVEGLRSNQADDLISLATEFRARLR